MKIPIFRQSCHALPLRCFLPFTLKSDNMEDMNLKPVSPEIIDYVEQKIIPRYASFDKAHHENHVRIVIEQSLKLTKHTPSINSDMVYVIAAFHDLGLVNGRQNHHKDSRRS